MKSYFRSLKRSKSKNVDEVKQARKSKPAGLTYNRGLTNEDKEQKMGKQNIRDNGDYGGDDLNLPLVESSLSKQETSVEANETNANDFNTSSFWKEPFMEVDLDSMMEDESEETNQILQGDAATNLDKSQVQFTAVAFWKDPMPDIDLSADSEVMPVDKNYKTHDNDIECNEKQQNEKLIPASPEFEEEFNSAQFWKDPIQDISLGDLIDIGEANCEGNVLGFMKANKRNLKGNILTGNATKIVNNCEDMSQKIEILEDSYKCLRFNLENVKRAILKLEDRVKHLEI